MSTVRRIVAFLMLAALSLVLAPSAIGAQSPGAVGLERAIAAQVAHSDRLLARSGVVGTGVGVGADGQAEIRVYTARRGVSGVPAAVDGVRVEVEVTGPFVAMHHAPGHGGGPGGGGGGGGGGTAEPSNTDRWPRPVPIGISTGNALECSSGTIGARVRDADGRVYALSNNHVLALSNAGTIGDRVLQPGRYDTGCVDSGSNDLGTLADYEPLVFGGADNVMDAALGLTTEAALRDDTPAAGYGKPRAGVGVPPSLNEAVQKYGRTTSLTRGTITGINAIVNVGYPGGTARFVDQIVVSGRNFLKSGDSGSLLVTDPGRQPVGLLFAGTSNGRTAIANPIGPVLAEFGVTVDGD